MSDLSLIEALERLQQPVPDPNEYGIRASSFSQGFNQGLSAAIAFLRQQPTPDSDPASEQPDELPLVSESLWKRAVDMGTQLHLILDPEYDSMRNVQLFRKMHGATLRELVKAVEPTLDADRAKAIVAVRDTLICIEREDFSHLHKAETLVRAYETALKPHWRK